jgi:glucose dehydrogenase
MVIGDTLYVHTPFPNKVYAINLNDQSIIWEYKPNQNPDTIPVMCCDTVNRGLGYAEGTIFLQQADTNLVALDAKTGAVKWRSAMAIRSRQHEHQRAVVIKDKVLTGISGGEFGVRGFVAAYKIADGSLAWKATARARMPRC